MSDERKTVEDVAKAAGVSLMTVSRAINGRPGVSETTRRTILEIADRMGYRPNRMARGLASRNTSTFGIVFPDMANPFFAILAKAATDMARLSNLAVFVMNTDEDPSLELAAYDSLIEERINGVIVSGSRLPRAKLLQAVSRFNAAALVNSDVHGDRIVNIDVDDQAGVFAAVSYLISSGRKHIGFIAGPKESCSGRRRLAGFKAALQEHGMAFDVGAMERCVPNMAGGTAAIAALLERRPKLDAVVAYNDITAIGVLRGLADSGRSVPADLSIIGVDDIPYAALVRPALSTLRIDIPTLGGEAMRALIDLRDGKPAPVFSPLKLELVLRASA